jgi:hypothetical protein
MMPAVVEHHRRSVARHRHVEDGDAADGLPMLRGEREGGWSAPVVPGQEEALLAENVVDQAPHIMDKRLRHGKDSDWKSCAPGPSINSGGASDDLHLAMQRALAACIALDQTQKRRG